ncbi:fibroblast growth factor receptor 4-like [Patiria miniata]|uniref:receptor protein-tyrosine kinase n=1 Tax=Patiria miniata TaxID=46514 RepID=A0A913ZZD1_PATMI|nr:fibroblast growth factor receptor 4-like [Patiria miniata]
MAVGKRSSCGYLFLIVSFFNKCCSVSSQEVELSRISRYEIEGQGTEFKCTVGREYYNRDYFSHSVWLLNGYPLFEHPDEFPATLESSKKITLHRNQTGSTLMCLLHPIEKNSTLTLNVMYPPSAVTLHVNTTHSCESDTECSADVTIGSRYRFACNASGSNPASNITWLINTKARSGMGQTEISPDWSQSRQDETNEDWETSSRIDLQILPEHHQGSITCRAMFPDGGTVFREITVKLNVDDKHDPPSAMTLQVNTTHSCESDTECSADVTIGSHYRFICNASGSNPASNITWLINTNACSGMGQTEIPPNWSQSRQDEANEDWETSSRMDLHILPEHHQGSIACRAMFPDGGTVFREIVMKLDPPSAMTLHVNTTHACESETVCRGNVTIGSRYRFICNASGSNLASNMTWLIKPKTEILPDGTQLRQEEANGDWETSSEINLQIRPEHRLGSNTCRVMCPDGGTVFREMVMELIVNDKLDILQLLAIIIPAAGTVLAVVVIVTACTLRSNAKRERAQEVTEVMEEGTTKKCNFPRSKITLFDVIGSGNFGQVFRATADGILQEGVETEVAVKVLKESADGAAVCDFKKEIAIHKTLKRHPNVVSMFGCCTDSEPFVIILELLPGGSLQGYLRNKKKAWMEEAVEGAKPVPPSELLAFASQIASGMEYLSSVGCIHRDLAVRNILLDKDMVCKLSDFGLARDVSETQQYERTSVGMIPVRWLAIESLLDDVYTTMSDVWSFGILLWEIVTLGAHPYRGLRARDVIDSIERGFRLANPAHCSEQLYEVMNKTWQETPSERPTFRELRETLEGMIPEAPIYLDMANFVADQYVGKNS